MVGLLILFGIFFAVGLFLILADVFQIPTMMTLKAMSDVGKEEKRKNRSMEIRTRRQSWPQRCGQRELIRHQRHTLPMRILRQHSY